MRIFIVEPRGFGGMTHYAYQLCNAMSGYVSEVTLITAKQYELDGYPHRFHVHKLLRLWNPHNKTTSAPNQNRIGQLWMKITRNIRRVFRGIRLFFEWMKLSRYLILERPDVVQFGEIEFPFEAIFLQHLKSRGFFLTQICHEFEPREMAVNFLVKINNRLLSNVFNTFSIIFFHSQSNLVRFHELYPGIPAERFRIIAMGNGQIFPTNGKGESVKDAILGRYGITRSESVVLFFGNITPSKGIPDLLHAFKKVHELNRRARLVIAGMPLKYIDVNDLFALASQLGIESVTSFDARYLPIEEVGPLIDLATVVVFPYRSSTQSASIQAAYAFGKPVIATRVGGLPDVVEEGKSGFLVEPGSPDQLSNAILRVINDPELAERMGCYAKRLSETRFSWGPIAGSIVGVYQKVLDEKYREDSTVL